MTRRLFILLGLLFVLGACAPKDDAKPISYKVKNSKPTVAGPVIAFGDSLTSALPMETPYSDYLASRLSEPVLNHGEMGITSAEALASLETKVLDHKPRVVVITIGGNDALIAEPLPVKESLDNLRNMIERIQATGALVVFGGIDPPIFDLEPSLRELPPSEIAKFGIQRFSQMNELAATMGAVTIGDIMQGLWLEKRYKADRVHPNSAGNEIISERIYQALQGHL